VAGHGVSAFLLPQGIHDKPVSVEWRSLTLMASGRMNEPMTGEPGQHENKTVLSGRTSPVPFGNTNARHGDKRAYICVMQDYAIAGRGSWPWGP
jgi:hypothetical protein